MTTVLELREKLKSELQYCNHVNDNSLAAHVNENIQWAWENWDKEHLLGNVNSERYTPEFRDEWIDCESFDTELLQINENE